MKEEIQEDGTRIVTITKTGRQQIKADIGQPLRIVFDMDAIIKDMLIKFLLIIIAFIMVMYIIWR